LDEPSDAEIVPTPHSGTAAVIAGDRGKGALTGGILAGGRSTRMGFDKAHLPVMGVSMFERVASVLAGVVDEVVALGRSESIAGIQRGPLAGLAPGLAYARPGNFVLVAVDHPLVRAETLAKLIELASPDRAVVPVDRGHRQVTCAVYPTAWEAEVIAEDEAGGSIQSLLDRMPHLAVPPETWREWGEDGRSWFSVDSLDEVDAMMTRFLGGADS